MSRWDSRDYERCLCCHLFVEPNPAYGDYPGLAAYMHLCGDSEADEALDASHEPRPSGMIRTLAWWKLHGPPAMRARFID